MCGRFVLAKAPREVARLFQLDEPPDVLAPRYNIAPTLNIAVVRIDTTCQRKLSMLRWGLIPHWNRDPRNGGIVNGRSETAFDKPTFRDAIKKRRCIIPASGFYEWRAVGKKKWPTYFSMAGDAVMPFAGVFDTWDGPDGTIESAAILTVPANELVKPLHERMPAILRPEQFAAWLDPAATTKEPVLALLQTYPVEEMAARPVSDRVNGVNCDAPELIEYCSPPEAPKPQPGLFDL